jgi:FKBP-type peptidyl-prolyl cis-trans isomerase 2
MNLFNPDMQKEKIAIISLVLIIIVVLSAFLVITYKDQLFGDEEKKVNPAIEYGDCADVYYIGRFTNGTIFDTNIKEVAIQAGIYSEEKEEFGLYTLARVFVDPDFLYYSPPEGYENYSQEYIAGYLNGLVGMKKGGIKNVTIPPEDAYGDWNISLAEELFEYYFGAPHWPRNVTNNISSTISKEELTYYYNQSIDLENLTVNQTINYIDEDIFSPEGDPVVWQIQITNISEGNVTIKNIIPNGSIIKSEGMWDNTVIINNETTFTMRGDPEIGEIYGQPGFYMKVMDFNETDIIVAINFYAEDPLFINETLIFQLEIINVYKTSLELDES